MLFWHVLASLHHQEEQVGSTSPQVAREVVDAAFLEMSKARFVHGRRWIKMSFKVPFSPNRLRFHVKTWRFKFGMGFEL